MRNTIVLWCRACIMVILASGECSGQTVIQVSGGASITCPATPLASWNTPPTGITFSNWSRGSGVTCASAVNGLSGSAFNTANASASFSANKYFKVTIAADNSHSFILNSITWNTAISSGTCVFDVQYRNNGGPLTSFGANAQTGTTSNLFSGAVTIAPGTSIDLFLIPSGTLATGTTVRWLNGSSITLTASETSPLPVSIIYFKGNNFGDHNQLFWSTAFEQNNTGFEILRSRDGINYTVIDFVSTKAINGNSIEVINYSYTDNDPGGIKQFYCLRQIDLDSHSKLSMVLMIRAENPVSFSMDAVFPNPARESVNMMIASASKDRLTVVITDLLGRTLLEKIINVEAGSITIPIDIHSFGNGTYVVSLTGTRNGEKITGKFVKQ